MEERIVQVDEMMTSASIALVSQRLSVAKPWLGSKYTSQRSQLSAEEQASYLANNPTQGQTIPPTPFNDKRETSESNKFIHTKQGRAQ